MKMHPHLLAQMRAATRNMMRKNPVDVADVIQTALRQANMLPADATRQPAQPQMRDINPPPGGAQAFAPADEPAAPPSPPTAHAAHAAPSMPDLSGMLANLTRSLDAAHGGAGMFAGAQAAHTWPGKFIAGSYTNAAGTRDYKLYVPSTHSGKPAGLVVMLHGCTQNPDDFAVGTQMNEVAEELGCLVVYPAQCVQANTSRCWNWFKAVDQQRDQGEPSIIAGITREVMARHPVDRAQVFVAGLSAGGAMATIMGTLYPDLYAAVGVHSGLPFASAHDLPSALAAMKGDFRRGHSPGDALPIIVFHGDKDTTVHPANGEELIAQVASRHASAVAVEPGKVPNGHTYTRRSHMRADGSVHAEHWIIHGAGHAWSGGKAAGSYTDGRGPDASREMMRFFRTVGGDEARAA